MPKSKLRARLVLIGLALLVVPVLLLLAELGVRLFARKLDPLEVFITSPQLRSDTQGEATRGLFEFDPLLTIRLRANIRGLWWDYTPVNTNGAHLRLDHEVGAKRGVRIVCLGDSVTFGYRVPIAHDPARSAEFDPEEKPYPRLLEEMLRAKFPGREIEVLPLACPGYTTKQGLEWLRRDIAGLQPDLVTACFGFNDVRAAGLPDRATFPATSGQILARRLIMHSQLLLHLSQAAQAKRNLSSTLPQPRSSEEEYVANLMEMGSLSRANRAWFGIILPVYRDPNTPGDYPEMKSHPGDPEEGRRMTLYRDRLRSHAGEKGFPCLEILELTEAGWPANTALFGERIHPNAAGHRLMAERLQDFLADPLGEKLK